MGIEELTDYGVKTEHGELLLFCLQPTNIAVLSESSMAVKIYALISVLKSVAELEFVCLNSRESYESIKHFLAKRMEAEPVPQIRRLLEEDSHQLDRLQVTMATAREFLLAVRADGKSEAEIQQLVSHIERTLKQYSIRAHHAEREEVKRILAVYYAQNVTTEKFEDIDGERWLIV